MEGPKKRFFRHGVGSLSDGMLPNRVAGGNPAGDGESLEDEGAAGGEESAAPARTVLSRKELARELRRQAYQKAKQARANDPRHLAMKERARQQRRELYRKAKEQRKAREAELESTHQAARESAHAEAKRQLTERVRGAIGKASEASREASTEPLRETPENGRSSSRENARAEAKRQLAERVRGAIGNTSESGRALARDIEHALQGAGVRELMERLRKESSALAARHRFALVGSNDESGSAGKLDADLSSGLASMPPQAEDDEGVGIQPDEPS